MPAGLVLSDLHLFAARSTAEHMLRELEPQLADAELCILNGDIFDFHWLTGKDAPTMAAQAMDWLTALARKASHARIFYIMGNHDNLQQLADLLGGTREKNLAWSPTHLKLGDKLFLHGDLPLAGKAFDKRPLDSRVRSPHLLRHKTYDLAINTQAHRLAASLATPALCAHLITRAFARHPHADLEGARHIYFGHTHHPFNGLEHGGRIFHNTGSTVRHMKTNPIRFTYD